MFLGRGSVKGGRTPSAHNSFFLGGKCGKKVLSRSAIIISDDAQRAADPRHHERRALGESEQNLTIT